MKKQLCSLLTALALAVGLVGCSLSTPDSVGTIGNVDMRRPLPTFPLPRGTRTRCTTSMKTVL